MPITGQESALKAALISSIQAGIAAACGYSVMTPNCIDGLAKGIADAIIPFLVANIQVNVGQITLSAGVTGPTAAPGSPTPIPALPGTVTTTGTIS